MVGTSCAQSPQNRSQRSQKTVGQSKLPVSWCQKRHDAQNFVKRGGLNFRTKVIQRSLGRRRVLPKWNNARSQTGLSCGVTAHFREQGYDHVGGVDAAEAGMDPTLIEAQLRQMTPDQLRSLVSAYLPAGADHGRAGQDDRGGAAQPGGPAVARGHGTMDRRRNGAGECAGSGDVCRVAGAGARRHDVRGDASVGRPAGPQTPGATRTAAEDDARSAPAAPDRQSSGAAKAGAGDCAQSSLGPGAAERAGETGERNSRRPPGRDGRHHPPGIGSAAAGVRRSHQTRHPVGGERQRGGALYLARSGYTASANAACSKS